MLYNVNMDTKYAFIRARDDTASKLKTLASLRRISMIDLLEELVIEEWNRTDFVHAELLLLGRSKKKGPRRRPL